MIPVDLEGSMFYKGSFCINKDCVTFTAEVLLYTRKADLLMEELLLFAVFTLGHHAVEALVVVTAILTTELVDVVLERDRRRGHTAEHRHPPVLRYPGYNLPASPRSPASR